MKSLKIERPGDVFAPKPGGLAEARQRADTADELASRRDGLRWRPESREVLVDNRCLSPARSLRRGPRGALNQPAPER